MDLTTCYCMNPQCALYGKTGLAAQLKIYDWQRASPRFRCLKCRRVFSASTGTANAGVRADLTTYRRGAQTLAEGVSIRATGRLIETDKDTVQHWLPILSQHCGNLMNRLRRLPQFASDRMPIGRTVDVRLQKGSASDRARAVARNL